MSRSQKLSHPLAKPATLPWTSYLADVARIWFAYLGWVASRFHPAFRGRESKTRKKAGDVVDRAWNTDRLEEAVEMGITARIHPEWLKVGATPHGLEQNDWLQQFLTAGSLKRLLSGEDSVLFRNHLCEVESSKDTEAQIVQDTGEGAAARFRQHLAELQSLNDTALLRIPGRSWFALGLRRMDPGSASDWLGTVWEQEVAMAYLAVRAWLADLGRRAEIVAQRRS